MLARRRVLIRVVNADDGSEEWVEVEPEVARVLAKPEPRLKEKLLKRPRSIEHAAERASDALARYWGGPGHAWEGPRFRFDWLIGESPTWSGPESVWLWHAELELWVCRFCGHLAELPEVAYCLGCERSGRDGVIRPPTRSDLEKRREGRKVYTPVAGLRGGRE